MTAKPLKRKIITTSDGSKSLYIPEMDESYHSSHGAIQESNHVFIKNGLHLFDKYDHINILEIGFGTGLNALLAYLYGYKNKSSIYFHSIEKYPLEETEFQNLNYSKIVEQDTNTVFSDMHQAKWNVDVNISNNFVLHKAKGDLIKTDFEQRFNLIFFDAFAPSKQPKLWTAEVFQKMYDSLLKDGVLVTYSAKGQVRRNMQSAGFSVERLEGPPGKREMLRALKV